MRASDLRSYPSSASTRRSAPSRPLLVGGAVLAMVLVVGLAITITRPSSEMVVMSPPNIAVEQVGAKKVPLRDYPDRPWLSYWKTNSSFLGDPLWSERPFDVHASCVGFTNYVVCLNPDPEVQGTTWQFLPLLLGTSQLPAGLATQLDAPLAPIVSGYIAALQAQGTDWLYWLGRVISPAFCPQEQGECFQVFQRQVLHWSRVSADPKDVRLSPLGLQTTK
ncbi:MAG: hypothetical protein EPO21_01515 [Chloroflexota bacterium]|nr:MAG: hypothetical protein EPO21_01515 [Chloroflexota bacterium]